MKKVRRRERCARHLRPLSIYIISKVSFHIAKGVQAVRMFAAVLLSLVSIDASAQTAEDAHVQRMGILADAALNAQYHETMAVMAQADKKRAADLERGVSKPDRRPAYQAALIAAERGWLAYRDANCTSVGLVFRDGAYEDEADGKCIAEMDQKRTAELKTLYDNMNEWK